MLRLTLPWPPSVNKIWRTVKGRHLLSKEGRLYRKSVAYVVMQAGARGFGARAIKVKAIAYLPDKHRRDIDNLGKAVYDALEEARVFDDDSQILDSHWVKGPIDRANPRIEISLEAV